MQGLLVLLFVLQNTAARLLTKSPKYSQVTPLLIQLHCFLLLYILFPASLLISESGLAHHFYPLLWAFKSFSVDMSAFSLIFSPVIVSDYFQMNVFLILTYESFKHDEPVLIVYLGTLLLSACHINMICANLCS